MAETILRMSEIIKELAECLLTREVMRLPHAQVLADVKVEIYTSETTYFIRDFRNLALPFIRVFNHPNPVRWKTDYEGQPNVTENVLVGLEDAETLPFDNWTDVQVQVTRNPWGFDCDITLMGGMRKKVYFRGQLLIDSNVKRIDWFPLFKLYADLAGETKLPF